MALQELSYVHFYQSNWQRNSPSKGRFVHNEEAEILLQCFVGQKSVSSAVTMMLLKMACSVGLEQIEWLMKFSFANTLVPVDECVCYYS